MILKSCFIALLLLLAVPGEAGEFINLDFEEVRQPLLFLDPPRNVHLASADALPGWNATQKDVLVNSVIYNDVSLGSGSVDLFGTFPPRAQFGAEFVVSGNYAVGLQSGFGLAALSQIGTIPVGSRSLLFDSIGGGFLISVGGSLSPVGYVSDGRTASGIVYRTYGVDIAPLAGQEIEIKFSSAPAAPDFFLDNIRFSSNIVVPEPATFGLITIGVLAISCALRSPKRTS